MWHTGIWMFTALKDAPFNWDVSVEPGNVTKAHHFFANAVVASAEHRAPAEAWAWLSFLTSSEDAVKTRLAASWELPAVADQSLVRSYLSQTPPDNREAVFDALVGHRRAAGHRAAVADVGHRDAGPARRLSSARSPCRTP